MTFRLALKDLAHAQSIYRSQLAKERLFVPCDTPLEVNTAVEILLEVLETKAGVHLQGTVLHFLDAATAASHKLSNSCGFVAAVPLTEELKGPLRGLLTGALKNNIVGGSNISEEVERFLAQADEEVDHYRVLGVERSASSGDIRSAYLKLMKAFHPDNYFNRIEDELQTKLEIAYQKVVSAFDILADQKRRDAYDISLGHFAGAVDGSSEDVKRKRAELEEYRSKNAGRIRKAKDLWDAALEDEKAGRLKDARSKVKLAINFDPRNPMFERKLQQLDEA